MIERTFPIQPQDKAKPHPMQIPWKIAELAYSVYSAKYGRSQSLEGLADRGGFGPGEMDMFLPNWREMCDENTQLKKRIAELETEINKHCALKNDIMELKDLLRHCWVHIGYPDCGFRQMTSRQKAVYISIVDPEEAIEEAKRDLLAKEMKEN